MNEALLELDRIIQIILARPDARIVRTHRTARDRRIQIAFDNHSALPTLDNLSAGQSTLLSIFGTALRYGTHMQPVAIARNAAGIVLVDEIDAHLHADLQYEAVPQLMAMFPKIQFIVTSHSPLPPLGMEKRFGSEGFQILEMPTASLISAERYGEFLRSFEIYQSTKAFEETLKKVGSDGKPLVIGEGQTDPIYFRTAAELLGYADIVEQVEFK
ncbi:MAG: AAA family ATPase, partial [Rhodomicrobium sp.]|nr:AAA family ATPase [Rhodomicrobium sp.]